MRFFRVLYLWMFAVFLLAPIVVIAAVSVNEKRFLSFPPKGFSLHWYAEIFLAEDWFAALLNSLVIALSSSVLALLIAAPIAYVLWRRGWRYARALFSMGIAPFVLPPVIMALAFLLWFTTLGMYGLKINVIIAHGVFLLALPLVTLSLGLESIDKSLVEASRTLGATPKTVFLTVVFPIAAPYAFAGFAFCFVLSLNEYIIALMTVGSTLETLPIKIFNALRYGYTPIIASIAVLFLLVNVLVFSAIARLSNLPKILGAEE